MLECGKIVNTHGIRGEIKLDPWCDGDQFFSFVESVYVDGAEYALVSHRAHKNLVLLKLAGIDSIEEAEKLKNKILCVDKHAVALPDGHYFLEDIYGFDVFDLRKNAVIGTLRQVRELPHGRLYIVDCEGGEIMIPAVPAFDRGVDLKQKRLTVETIRGMLPDED